MEAAELEQSLRALQLPPPQPQQQKPPPGSGGGGAIGSPALRRAAAAAPFLPAPLPQPLQFQELPPPAAAPLQHFTFNPEDD